MEWVTELWLDLRKMRNAPCKDQIARLQKEIDRIKITHRYCQGLCEKRGSEHGNR